MGDSSVGLLDGELHSGACRGAANCRFESVIGQHGGPERWVQWRNDLRCGERQMVIRVEHSGARFNQRDNGDARQYASGMIEPRKTRKTRKGKVREVMG